MLLENHIHRGKDRKGRSKISMTNLTEVTNDNAAFANVAGKTYRREKAV